MASTVKNGIACLRKGNRPRRLQALIDGHAQRRKQLTPESHHRINTYYASIDKVLSDLELRFSGNDQEIVCALGNIYNIETPDKESFSLVYEFYNIDGEILEAEQKMRLHDCFRNMLGWQCRRMIFSIYFQSFLRWCISLQ